MLRPLRGSFGLDRGACRACPRAMADPIPTRTKEEDAAASRVGSTLRGKWRLDALLGVGGVAAVYAATHRNGQRAALKVMHPELARDRGIVERFLREAYVANKVGHPACVRVMDDDVTEGEEPFLVMELLEGETVRDYWRRTGRTIPASQALHIAERVLDCLSACHAVGVVHRDLKPANIFLVRSGVIKLLDFGVAREEGTRHEGDKTVGLALGTPAYMSPEQAKGQIDRIDGRSDLFSVGALLHALITGRRIHRGKTEKESLHLAANEPVPSVATIDPSLPGELVRLIDKALAWEPERRFSSARELQSAVISAMRVAADALRSASDEEPEDAPDLTPVHEVVARDDARVREVEGVLAAWEDALVAGILHGFESASAEPALRRAFDVCIEVQRKRSAAIALVVRPFGFAAFDHVVWEPARPLSAVPHRLFEAGVRVLRIMPGLAFAELRTLLACIGARGDVDVGASLWEAALGHVRVDACVVAGLGDIESRERFGAESLRDETRAAHRVHAARDAGAAWGDEASPLAPDDVIRAVYASQLGQDRWDERYAELYTDGLLQGARTRNVGAVLGAIRKVAAELYAARRYDDASSLREALVERLARRVGPKDAPKLAAAVTSAMLGKEALESLFRTASEHPEDVARMRALLDEIPSGRSVQRARGRGARGAGRAAVRALGGRRAPLGPGASCDPRGSTLERADGPQGALAGRDFAARSSRRAPREHGRRARDAARGGIGSRRDRRVARGGSRGGDARETVRDLLRGVGDVRQRSHALRRPRLARGRADRLVAPRAVRGACVRLLGGADGRAGSRARGRDARGPRPRRAAPERRAARARRAQPSRAHARRRDGAARDRAARHARPRVRRRRAARDPRRRERRSARRGARGALDRRRRGLAAVAARRRHGAGSRRR